MIIYRVTNCRHLCSWSHGASVASRVVKFAGASSSLLNSLALAFHISAPFCLHLCLACYLWHLFAVEEGVNKSITPLPHPSFRFPLPSVFSVKYLRFTLVCFDGHKSRVSENDIKFGVQRSAKRLVRGCEKFVPALAYLFCLALPGSCLARFAYLLADLCRYHSRYVCHSKHQS